jgi:protein-tyrosine-phosphatase
MKEIGIDMSRQRSKSVDAFTGQHFDLVIKLLGAQIVGQWQSEVAKRIYVFASALYYGIAVEELNGLDLSYTRPLGSPWDSVQMAAEEWVRSARAQKQI